MHFILPEIFGGRTSMRDNNDFDRDSRGQYNDYYKDDRYANSVFVLSLSLSRHYPLHKKTWLEVKNFFHAQLT